MAAKRGLGRGFAALINNGSSSAAGGDGASGRIKQIAVENIDKNARQPRQTFEKQALEKLTQSVRERGVLQPLLVRASGAGYELIAGERRLRAAIDAGLKQVPAIVMDVQDGEALQVALVENLQREDLNVLEEAAGYETLAHDFDMTQERIAERVGKARASVTNTMRLLTLPDEVRQLLADGELSAGHGKLLTGLDIPEEQILFARRAVSEGVSVRNLEKLIQKAKRAPRRPRAVRADMPATHATYLADKLSSHFGTGVRITPSRTFANGKKGKGAVEIDFFSNEDLDRILEVIGVTTD